jgi:hypothetical protein
MPVEILHADLGENTRHQVGTDAALDTCHGTQTATGRPSVAVGRAPRTAAEQPSASELFGSHGEAEVGLTGLDRQDHGAQSGGPGGTRVRHVVDGYAGLAHLLLQRLPKTGVAQKVAGSDDLDLPHRNVGVGQGRPGRLCSQAHHIRFGMFAELGHVDTENPYRL